MSNKTRTLKNRDVILKHIHSNTFGDRNTEMLSVLLGLDDHNRVRTLTDAGKKFGVSREWVRQIREKAINWDFIMIEREERQTAKEDRRKTLVEMASTVTDTTTQRDNVYFSMLLKNDPELKALLQVVIPNDRRAHIVNLRAAAAKKLRFTYHLSLPLIALLMHRDHTTIINLLRH